MERFYYDILYTQEAPAIPGGIVWILAGRNFSFGPNLLFALNQLGAEGWEVICVGDIALNSRSEIILKRRVVA